MLGELCQYSTQCQLKSGYYAKCDKGMCACESGYETVNGFCELKIATSWTTEMIIAVGVVCISVVVIAFLLLIIKRRPNLRLSDRWSRRFRRGSTQDLPDIFYVPPPAYEKPPSFEEAIKMLRTSDGELNGESNVETASSRAGTSTGIDCNNSQNIEPMNFNVTSENHKTELPETQSNIESGSDNNGFAND
ncbi:Uncharacterised protein g1790 [Pycnogonum litorale]